MTQFKIPNCMHYMSRTVKGQQASLLRLFVGGKFYVTKFHQIRSYMAARCARLVRELRARLRTAAKARVVAKASWSTV